ncbi:putative MND1 domain-containing protein [Haematococcus lacustris]
MSKRKGLSAEEKRDKLLEVFHESADVFVLKDIEKAAVKKGINSQLVKDLLKSLTDDDLVRVEKIGASNFYWSFPSDASVKVINELSKAESELEAVRKRKREVAASLEQEKKGRQDTAARAQQMAQLAQLKQQVAEAQAELDKYKDNDPETVEAMRTGAVAARDAANRWLDNIHCLMSWSKKQFQGQEESLNGFFAENGYKDNMEYID